MIGTKDIHSLKSVAYDHIKEKIIGCEIMPGERIREDVLADEMGISRTPVREAVNRLVMDGLIINVPRKGLYCTDITPRLVDSVCDLRRMVDSFAIDYCVGRLKDTDIRNLYSLLKGMNNKEEEQKIHLQFHTYFIKATENVLLVRVESIYDAYLAMMINLLQPYSAKQRDEQSDQEHWSLVEAVRDGNREKADQICVSHIERLRLELKTILEK